MKISSQDQRDGTSRRGRGFKSVAAEVRDGCLGMERYVASWESEGRVKDLLEGLWLITHTNGNLGLYTVFKRKWHS